MLNVLVAIDNGQSCLCCCAVEGGHCNNKATFKPHADLKFSKRILKSCQASLLKFGDSYLASKRVQLPSVALFASVEELVARPEQTGERRTELQAYG